MEREDDTGDTHTLALHATGSKCLRLYNAWKQHMHMPTRTHMRTCTWTRILACSLHSAWRRASRTHTTTWQAPSRPAETCQVRSTLLCSPRRVCCPVRALPRGVAAQGGGQHPSASALLHVLPCAGAALGGGAAIRGDGSGSVLGPSCAGAACLGAALHGRLEGRALPEAGRLPASWCAAAPLPGRCVADRHGRARQTGEKLARSSHRRIDG